MAAFDQIRFLHLKKYLLCTLLVLKQIQFAKQRGKNMLDSENQKLSFTDAFEYRCS